MFRLLPRLLPRRWRSPLLPALFLLGWSLAIGCFLAAPNRAAPAAPKAADIGTVDPIPPKYALGAKFYREACGACHLALPPAVFPSETWRQLLSETQHYGREIELLVPTHRIITWQYLRDYSRPQREDEEVPFRLNSSRYFKALHPQVDLPRPVSLRTCATCHPQAADDNFREWTLEAEPAEPQAEPAEPQNDSQSNS